MVPLAELHHTRAGTGEPLLLLHALGGDRHMWDPVLERLARDRELVVPDLPGFGSAPALPAGIAPSAAALAAAAAGVLDGLGMASAHVAGISLGGWVALELAALGRGRSVTALCPAGLWSRPLGPGGGMRRRRLGLLLRPLLPVLLALPAARRAALAEVVAYPERVPARAAAGLVRAYLTAPGYDAASREMRSSRFTRSADLDVPVTVAWAEHDRLVKRARLEIPGVRELVLHDCGHVPTWDDPEQVADVLLEGSSPAR